MHSTSLRELTLALNTIDPVTSFLALEMTSFQNKQRKRRILACFSTYIRRIIEAPQVGLWVLKTVGCNYEHHLTMQMSQKIYANVLHAFLYPHNETEPPATGKKERKRRTVFL